MATIDRVRELHDRAVQELVEAHQNRDDERMILAVRFDRPDEDDIRLLEVLEDFPGGDDDELMEMDFEQSARLLILGTLHLVLGSPGQVFAAIDRDDPILKQVVADGQVVYSSGDEVADRLRSALQL